MMRRTIPLLITFLTGVVLMVSRFLPPIASLGENFTIWFDILAAIAFLLGGGNLLKVHWKKVQKQVKGWGYSVITITAFLFTLTVGLGKCGVSPSEAYPFAVQVSHQQGSLAWIVVETSVHLAAPAEGEAITIGKGADADIRVEGDGVADVHCRISRAGDEFFVENLGDSRTILKGARVEGPTRLTNGDRLRVGDVGDPVVTFRSGSAMILQMKRKDPSASPTRIGSGEDSDIHLLGDPGVQPNHASITFTDEAVLTIVGLDTGQATTINGQTATELTVLAHGDALGIGGFLVRYRRNSWLTGNYEGTGEQSAFWYCYEYGFKPLVAATFAMLAFYVASAAFRAFRAKNLEAIVLLLTAFMILMGRTFLGTVITAWAPEWMQVPTITVWIMKVVNSAGNRAIMIGIALGIASMSLRVILGIDRSYLGGKD